MEFGKVVATRKRRKTPIASARVTKGRGSSVQIHLTGDEAVKLGLVPGQTIVFTSKRRFRVSAA